MSEDVETLGSLIATMPAAEHSFSTLRELPPPGAARFVSKSATGFRWEPIPADVWTRLSDRERGEIAIERALVWLDENGEKEASPLPFMDDDDAVSGTEHLTGRRIKTLRDAICITHSMIHENAVESRIAVALWGVLLFLITGIHPAAFAPEVAEILLEAIARRICR